MRTGAAAGHRGYYHEAVCYGSDDELLAVATPFLLGGVAAGEPTVVALGTRNAALVRAALPPDSGVTFLPGDGMYPRPTSAIRSYRDLLAAYVRQGARQIRIIGELPPAALGVTWDWWARYESAVNHAYDEFPLWSMCAYDTRTTPAHVLAEVARTHPRHTTPDGRHLPSPTYVEPATYLRESPPAPADPLQATPPQVDLTSPTAAQARAAVQGAARGRLPADDVQDLVVAVSETVSNALRHGRPPVRMRLWAGPDRIVVTVSDGGQGPTDPFAGLLPTGNGAVGGLGLWIAYQSCNHVTSHRGPDGFTLRLTAGNPHFAG
ncbi:anti-sigma factor RsbA family regulatory protein [Micromonospora olivasterospora]|uniref:Anti-sigma regulatory factor (Ser/Thr protein kinase) n=1 Tax=Micromonospora olivasterospora TaxID=1880 RepID=A0A562IF21_MICOL|nr:sensor histidine kinase [Micromonospora olivasterospora]TWH69194.1 anti-sigma regulatory factor (Ser/Thr protein kinase) [Micromonospora olivasterospora]